MGTKKRGRPAGQKKKKGFSLWSQAIKEGKKGIPRKGTEDYKFVKKIHERLKAEAAAEKEEESEE